MSPELIGILSVGVALGLLIVALLRSTNARIERSEDRFQRMAPRMDERFRQKGEHFGQMDARFAGMQALMNDRLGRSEGLFNTRFERLEDRFEKLEARQYEIAHGLTRIEALQIDAVARAQSRRGARGHPPRHGGGGVD